jgi:hypothetical protein
MMFRNLMIVWVPIFKLLNLRVAHRFGGGGVESKMLH